jgi:Zn-dependent M28 family amino/carboxypeptidase
MLLALLLLEIAQTFKNLPEAPKRSIVFTIVTGEVWFIGF